MNDKTAQAIISAIVVCSFTGATIGWMVTPPQHEATQTLALLTGALASGFGQVVNYWLSSNRASKE
jgi:Na+/alanine symporter